MLTKVFLWLAFSILPITVTANNFCHKSKVRWRLKDGTFKIKSYSYCYGKNKSKIKSKNCQKKCLATHFPASPLRVKGMDDSFGSPLFKACRQSGGQPQIIEHLVGKNWHKTNWCYFAKDNSFIDLNTYFFGVTNLGR